MVFSCGVYHTSGTEQLLPALSQSVVQPVICLYILPKGFRKIRHYGFLSNRCSLVFKQQQMQLGVTPVKQTTGWKMIAKEKLHFDAEQCPCCKKRKNERTV